MIVVRNSRKREGFYDRESEDESWMAGFEPMLHPPGAKSGPHLEGEEFRGLVGVWAEDRVGFSACVRANAASRGG
jgi:hypothetical protein